LHHVYTSKAGVRVEKVPNGIRILVRTRARAPFRLQLQKAQQPCLNTPFNATFLYSTSAFTRFVLLYSKYNMSALRPLANTGVFGLVRRMSWYRRVIVH
jgi:hypothetical protein